MPQNVPRNFVSVGHLSRDYKTQRETLLDNDVNILF